MKQLLLFLLSTLISAALNAQPSIGGQPESFKYSGLSANFDSKYITKPDLEQLVFLDEMDSKSGNPYRIAVNIPVSMNMTSSGTWTELPDYSGRIWRLNIFSPDAKALIVYYNQFYLPAGTRLFLYNDNQKQVLGAYTELNNPESVLFANEMIGGESVTLEYFEPAGTIDEPIIEIGEIGYVYRSEVALNPDIPSYTASGSCEVNINCQEGNNWQDEKNGVCRIQVKNGSNTYLCTGCLMNNTSQNCTPLILLADHCAYSSSYSTSDNMNQWVFYFHYEASSCGGLIPSGTKTKTGCSLKAHDTYGSNNLGSDFYLVQLNNAITMSDGLYFNGWSRTTSASTSGVSIHHPDGDIMKISTYTSTLVSAFVGASGSHWEVIWAPTTNGHGVTEPGSSGSPIFNNTGLVVGTLTGGDSYCTTPYNPDYYGKFSYHWQSNGTTSAKQLKPWLDPTNMNVTTLNGSYSCIPGGLEETARLNASVYCYPNPASDYLYISLGENTLKDPVVRLYSRIGQLIYYHTFVGKFQGELIVDLHKQPSGLYFLSLEVGNILISKKIIIEQSK